jgi:hypothetical protein
MNIIIIIIIIEVLYKLIFIHPLFITKYRLYVFIINFCMNISHIFRI